MQHDTESTNVAEFEFGEWLKKTKLDSYQLALEEEG
jgi:hypothetical protein